MSAPRVLGFAALLLLVATPPRAADAQLTIGVTNALSIGAHSATEAGLEVSPGYSFEAVIGYDLGPSMSLFGGIARTTFGCSGGFCLDRDLTITGTHGLAGVEVRRGGPWARGALMYGRTEVGDADDADAGLGLRLGVGLSIGQRVRFRPGVSASWMDASAAGVTNNAVTFSVGLGIQLPIL